jgi:glucose/arabinose dehydrogenase
MEWPDSVSFMKISGLALIILLIRFGSALAAVNVPANPPPLTTSVVPAFNSVAFSQPVCLASPPGDPSRLFVCEKGGLLRLIPDVTAANPQAITFLDLPAALPVGESIATASEMGLLSVAFHPNYASNRQFYLFYSVNKGGAQYQRVSRFLVHDDNPNLADEDSEEVVIEQLDQAGNHNGGDMHFGPDGYLYISLGDEGGQNDAFQNGQKITQDFFSALLRIDVDKKPGNPPPNPHPAIRPSGGPARYAVPFDNPFVQGWDGRFNGVEIADLTTVRTEFWAVGFRNPWRFSFDPATGDLWLGDVGQDQWEEVNLIEKGGNYGWSTRDGNQAGPRPVSGATLIDPLYQYAHGSGSMQGNSITGGIIYRDNRFSMLTGAYIFADYVSGNLWSLRRNPTGPPTVTRIAGQGNISAFGTDPSNGDILMANLGGDIKRLISTPGAGSFPQTLTATGVFSDVPSLTPAPELVPYEVNVPFWSDHARKRRWYHLPSGQTMIWSKDDPWTFPAGSFWVKHFDLELDRDNPSSTRRIETRLFVKNASGAYGVSYKWNDEGTEATLVADEGDDFDLNITEQGNPSIQRWHIPSRAECMICHNAEAGYALSFNTRQLNREGSNGNLLTTMKNEGCFSNPVPSPNLLPRHLRADEVDQSLEGRVRSYLAVNCAYCHQTGPNPATWNGDPTLTLDETGLINGTATNNGGDPLNKLIVPGNVARSVIHARVARAPGFTPMPPLGSNERDRVSMDLLADWITNDLPSRQNYRVWRTTHFPNPEDGEPDEDADRDGRTNWEEYLAGTSPTTPGGYLVPSLQRADEEIVLNFPLPKNRSFQIETSTDLQLWTPWDIPGNAGLPHPGGAVSISGPGSTLSSQFFRLRLNEN